MTRDTRTQLLAALALVGCLAASTALSVALAGTLGRYKLTYTDKAEEGQPVEVSVGIAMGAFRGIFVNFLWMRANDMKEAGKFYEAVQLADAITRLQPRFPRVWVFHAWNLAYNISVQTQTADERWQWVNRGIELLRDKAIPANPNDMLIHKELAWIFLPETGGYTDDANPTDKRRLAQGWTVVMGPPPARGPEDRDRDTAIKKYTDWLRTIADAPETLDDAAAKEPLVKELLTELRGTGITKDMSLLGRYEFWNAVKRSAQRQFIESAYSPTDPSKITQDIARTARVRQLMEDPRYANAWKILVPHLRKRLLIDHYHMEPDRMIRYTDKFGPIDWRHHAAHSLYWSYRGVEMGIVRWTEENKRDYDFINTDRIVVQSVQDLFRSGELYFDFLSSTFPGQYVLCMGVPNGHFVQSYGELIEEQRPRS